MPFKHYNVDRRVNLPPEEFQCEYFQAGKPVIIEGAIEDWPARLWTLKLLQEKSGDNDVFVRRNTAQESYFNGKKYDIESMKFSEYIQNIISDNKKAQSSYLAVQNIKKALPELENDIAIPLYVEKIHAGPFLWIARKGHYEFCHFDPDDNFLIVLSGQKHVRLYPADQLEKLYPNQLGSKGKTIQSNVICSDPDLKRYPKFEHVTYYECTVNAGEILYFPAFWWHQVTSTEITISLNIFCGNSGTNAYLTKVMEGSQWPAFRYWLLNIVEQNRSKSQFQKVLQYLPETLSNFLLKQWHEIPTEEQLNKLVATVLEYCQLKEVPERSVQLKHAPPLKIRGLLWRS